jgi:hypothetical protein
MKKSIALSSLALTVALAVAAVPMAGEAVAAPTKAADSSKSPAKDDILLTQGQVSALEKKLADKTDWGTDGKARDSARSAVQGVSAGISRIRAADPKWDVSAWEALVKKASARLKSADETAAKTEGKAADGATVYYQFKSEASKLTDTLKLLDAIKNKPSELPIESEQIIAKTMPAIAAVASLDAFCKKSNIAALPVPVGESQVKAAEKCKLAASWKELGKSHLGLQVAGGVKREADRLGAVIAKAKKGESVDVSRHLDLLDPKRSIERTKAPYVEGAKTFELTLTDARFEPITAAAKPYAEALVEAGKASRWDSAAKLADASIAAAVAADYAKGSDLGEGKLVRQGSVADWYVEKDGLGRPVKRSRDALVLVQMKGEAYCRLSSRSFESTFANGAWSKPYSRGGLASFRVSACK